MTYSIVVYADGLLGIATVSGSIAVGSRVPWARKGVAAVATQGYTNPSIGPRVISLVQQGLSASEALRIALDEDPHPEMRQIGVVTPDRGCDAYTGSRCPDKKLHVVDEDRKIVVVGNLLRSEDVVYEVYRAFMKSSGNIVRRLVNAISAGHAAGGDARGDRSAAILIVGETPYGDLYDRVLDVRVDMSSRPIDDLISILREMGFI